MCANICGEKFGDTVPLSNMCETTCNAGPAVEGSVRVDTDRVLDTAAIVVLALVDVVADLPLPGRKVQPHPREACAACTQEPRFCDVTALINNIPIWAKWIVFVIELNLLLNLFWALGGVIANT